MQSNGMPNKRITETSDLRTIDHEDAGNLRHKFRPSSRLTLLVLDLALVVAPTMALIATIYGRLGFDTMLGAEDFVFCVISVSVLFVYGTGCYRHDALTDFPMAVTRLAVALLISTACLLPLIHFGLGLVMHSLPVRSISRETTILLLIQGIALTGGIIGRILFMGMMRRHWFCRKILVIGTGRKAAYLRELFSRSDRQLGQLFFLTEAYLGGRLPAGEPNIDTQSRLDAYSGDELQKILGIDQVVIAVDDQPDLQFDRLLPWKAIGIPVLDFSTFLEMETGRIDLRWTETDWLLYSPGFRFGHLDLVIKRIMDVVVSLCLLLITLPTFLVVSVIIFLEDNGPVFYRQQRVSYGGQAFWILKFRTMRTDAEANGPQWAKLGDGRITRIGHFLRRSRIDELPQLLNVLCGEMSLVGPRPERPVFVEQLSEKIRLYRLRHSVKSGITGWAQINYPYGDSEEGAVKKLEYDLYYLKNFSVLRDISIMIQTFRVLVFAKGGR